MVMSIKAVRWALELDIKASDGKLVLIALAEHMNANGNCFPSQCLLVQETGQSERTVRDHLTKLTSVGLIKRYKRQRSNGSQMSDGYMLFIAENPTKSTMPIATVEDEAFVPVDRDTAISETFDELETPVANLSKEAEADSADSKQPAANLSDPAADFSNPAADFSNPAANLSKAAADFSNSSANSAPLEPEVNPKEPFLKPEERTRKTDSSNSKHSKKKEKNALDAFVDIWQEYKVPLWSEIQVLTQRRQSLLSKLISEVGSFDTALDIFSCGIQEAALTDWFKTKKLSLENIMSNDKLIGLSERFKQREEDLIEDDFSSWTYEDFIEKWGKAPENLTWGNEA